MEYLSPKVLHVQIQSTYFIPCPTRIYNFPNAGESRQKARKKNHLKQLRFSRQRWITKAVALSHVTLGRATLARDLWNTRSLRIGTRHSCGTRAGLFSRRKAARCTYRRKITKPIQVLKTSRPPASSFWECDDISLVPSPPFVVLHHSPSSEFRCLAEGARWHSVTTLATFPTLSTDLLRQCQATRGATRRTTFPRNKAERLKSVRPFAVVQRFQRRIIPIPMCGETFPKLIARYETNREKKTENDDIFASWWEIVS